MSSYLFYVLLDYCVGQVSVPCCFCMLEFPIWNNSVTAHIASHVCINSISCVECELKFDSKNLLMKHLYSTHTGLSQGVSLDVSINNYERRRSKARAVLSRTNSVIKQSGINAADVLLLSGAANENTSPTTSLEINANTPMNNETDLNVEQVIANDAHNQSANIEIETESNAESNSAVGAACNESVADCVSRHEAAELSMKSHDAVRVGRRKARKPVRVSAEDDELAETTAKTGKTAGAHDDWVEISAASQPMAVQCSRCTYTCNTELNLKVCASFVFTFLRGDMTVVPGLQHLGSGVIHFILSFA